jgi:hypothetical protein
VHCPPGRGTPSSARETGHPVILAIGSREHISENCHGGRTWLTRSRAATAPRSGGHDRRV